MFRPPGYLLSKSKYLLGLQCPKLLWFTYNQKADLSEPDPMGRFVMEEGKKVGEVAQRLWPEGIKIEWSASPEAVAARSREALLKRQPLFEAGFIFQNVYAIADILVPVEDGAWDLIEVKSATQPKPEYYEDLAFQKQVYEGAGLVIRRCYLMFLNREYVRCGQLEPLKLFRKENVTDPVAELWPEVPARVETMIRLIAQLQPPEVKVGKQCDTPRLCPLEEKCWGFLPERDHVFHLTRGSQLAFKLLERGIIHFKDIPPEIELSDKQQIQVKSHLSGEAYVERKEIQKFVNKLKYPLYFLDFETIAPAIPLYEGSRPYEDIPFQFSLHVVERTGAKPVHQSYLAEGQNDPRPEVLKRLKDGLGNRGSIIAYSADYEKKCLRKSSEAFPEYAGWFEDVEGRFVDLLTPFSKFHYYHPKQNGSASMKSVLPALTELGYEELGIGEGGLARVKYMRIAYGDQVPAEEMTKVRNDLEKYCEMDTKGMVAILDILISEAQNLTGGAGK